MSDRSLGLGSPMDPANPLLRVALDFTHNEEKGFRVLDLSNVPLGIVWDRAFADFVRKDTSRVLPPGEYIFTVRHGEGFRVEQLPTEGLSEQTYQALIDHLQPFCEETFRALCVGLVSFPTPREIRQAAQSILGATARSAIRSLEDPDKLGDNFLTLIPTATDRLSSSRKIEQEGLVAFLIQDGGAHLPGGIVAMPGIPDEKGHMEVKIGYLPSSPLNDWLNAALKGRLVQVIDEEREQTLREVAEQFEGQRTWYEKAGARIKKLIGL